MGKRVFITVAEASGDQHAANLVRELKAQDPEIIVEGLGGSAMAEAGAIIHHDTVEGAAMGWKGALRFFEYRSLLAWTKKYFRTNPPDLLICIDSWSANWHWAKAAHRLNIPVMYYIAPQMWASRQGRVKRLRRYVDRVACILPFEEKFFRDHQVEATFVGHPLFDALPKDNPVDASQRFPNRAPVIGLVPGSRSSVARENFPNLLEVAERILEEFPKARFLIPTMPATHAAVEEVLRAHVQDGPTTAADPEGLQTVGAFTFGNKRFNELVSQCDLCISVSGTATLHVAGHGVPLIVVYRLNPVIWHLAARWIVKTRTYSLVNLLSDSRTSIVPEFIPWYGSNLPVATKALEYLRNPRLLAEQKEGLQRVIRPLNRPGASRNVARMAIDLMVGRATTEFNGLEP